MVCKSYGNVKINITKGTDLHHPDVYLAFQKEQPALDLDRMAQDPLSECLIDLGVSITPITDVPIIGLWRLSNAKASFNKAGSKNPIMHSQSTLPEYRSLNAEFPQDRSSATHIVYRHAYDLIFKIVRKELKFCKNDDAYKDNTVFSSNIHSYINKYKIADENKWSCSVRDEYHLSIQALKMILPIALHNILSSCTFDLC